MLRTYHGSCHCGAVRFQAEIDLAAGTSRCNCSYCAKIRNWVALVKPDAFKLLTSDQELGAYQFGTKQGRHRFCRTCGVRPFSQGDIPELGGAFYGINLGALDDASDAELAEAPINYVDGRNNNWFSAPAETRHL